MKKDLLVVADAACLGLAMVLLLAIGCAWQINMSESPIDGNPYGTPRGSSYTADAIGNPRWVSAHPRMSERVQRSFLLWILDIPVLLLCLPVFFTGTYTVPVVGVGYLCWRIWNVRRAMPHAIALGIVLILLISSLPWLYGALIVLGD